MNSRYLKHVNYLKIFTRMRTGSNQKGLYQTFLGLTFGAHFEVNGLLWATSIFVAIVGQYPRVTNSENPIPLEQVAEEI